MVRTAVAATGMAAVVAVSGWVAPAPVAASAPWRVEVMAALGDSISTGFNACGWFLSCVSRSWSVGTGSAVDSHYLRLRRAGVVETGGAVNLAVPGATSADLAAQAERAVARGAGYVTVLVGANDVCRDGVAEMTPVEEYRRNVARAFRVLRSEGVRVFVASVPDLKRLWAVGRRSAVARSFWRLGRVCQSMLARPASTAPEDRERRNRVRERVIAYNRVLAQECAAYGPGCRYDGGAVFATRFTLGHVSRWDHFHPSAEGQRLIAERTFAVVRQWLGEAALPRT
ncbi:SGNH/GDSL hydrolase family protein [Thermostaphylospora chromogena]|uniref:Lysophospholipase L1 n=1 Tax=Thermostaphylospora chromogena TaxID=35622 RepID=A0A1H1GZ69_9ACTN|nr:SGNH/GDSL hydrolase family protein [Thermostaphylospora chromogena]SDR18451.1 Lysophospholipase L1 [Thermostaphylospora chromogena]